MVYSSPSRNFSVDRAVTSEDDAGCEACSRALSEFLLNREAKWPLTVSVEGEWGSGESSFLLALEQHLRKGSDAKRAKRKTDKLPVIVRFNPCRGDNDETLWAAFADDLAKAIAKEQGFFDRLQGQVTLLISRLTSRHGWVTLLSAGPVFLIATGLLFSSLASTAKKGPRSLLQFAKAMNISPREIGQRKPEGRRTSRQRAVKLGAGTGLRAEQKPNSQDVKGAEWFRRVSSFGFLGVAVYLIALPLIGSRLKPLFPKPFGKDASKHRQAPHYPSGVAPIQDRYKHFRRIVEAYARDKTIFVFIDDLDRCAVPRAAELMRAINLTISTGLNTIVFIFGMDREKIEGLASKHAELLRSLRARARWMSIVS